MRCSSRVAWVSLKAAIEEIGLLGQLLVMAGQQYPVHPSGFDGGEDPVGGRAEGIDVLLAIRAPGSRFEPDLDAVSLVVEAWVRSLSLG
jgi:hypothetical protein